MYFVKYFLLQQVVGKLEEDKREVSFVRISFLTYKILLLIRKILGSFIPVFIPFNEIELVIVDILKKNKDLRNITW